MKPVKYKPKLAVFFLAIVLFCIYIGALVLWPKLLNADTYYLLPLVAPEGLLPEDRSIIIMRLRLASSILAAGIIVYLVFLNIRLALARPLKEEVLGVGKFLKLFAFAVASILTFYCLALAFSTRLAPEQLEPAKGIASMISTALIIVFIVIIIFFRPSSDKSISKKEVRGILTSGALSVMILAVIGILAAVIFILRN